MDYLDTLLLHQHYPDKQRVKHDVLRVVSQARSLRPQIGQLGMYIHSVHLDHIIYMKI